MSRSKHKQVSVPESVLIVLLSGKPVTREEILTTLQGKIVPGRLSTYMWVLKTLGAVITPSKIKNTIHSYTLTNPEVMTAYLSGRKNAGAQIPDLPGLMIAPAPVSASTAISETVEEASVVVMDLAQDEELITV